MALVETVSAGTVPAEPSTPDTRAREPRYSISEMSELTGVAVETLRYYERAGLMPDIDRTTAGRRRYTEDDRGWIVFIRRLRATAMPVGEIATYVAMVRAGEGTVEQRRAMLEAHRDRVRAAVDELTDALGALDRKIAHYEGVERGLDVSCSDEPVSSVRLVDR